jgi:hypothetical protein
MILYPSIKIIIRNLIYILEKDKEIDKEDFETAQIKLRTIILIEE